MSKNSATPASWAGRSHAGCEAARADPGTLDASPFHGEGHRETVVFNSSFNSDPHHFPRIRQQIGTGVRRTIDGELR